MLWRACCLVLGLCWGLHNAAMAQTAAECEDFPERCAEKPRLKLQFNFSAKAKKPNAAPSKPAEIKKSKAAKPKAEKSLVKKATPQKAKAKPNKRKQLPQAKPLQNSWQGLREEPVVTLLEEDLADIQGQFIIDLNIAALRAAGFDLLTISVPDLAQRLGLQENQIRSVQRRFLFSAVVKASAEQLTQLNANPLVQEVHNDTQIKAAGNALPLSWGLDRLDTPTLPLDGKFDRVEGDYDSRIYVFDTSIRNDATEFQTRVKLGAEFVVNSTKEKLDCRAHGTEMASLIAGRTTGAAPSAEIVGLTVLPCGRRKTGEASGLIEAVEWLLIREADHGDGKPVVANMSLTGKWSRKINSAVTVLTENQVAVVVAAGNNAQDACRFSPASAKDAITVAATGPKDETPGFSNFGQCVDIHAPGRLLTAFTDSETEAYIVVNGTSGAAALVSGLLARSLKVKGPNAASQWLMDAALPAKLWRDDKSDHRLVQINSKWRKTCKAETCDE